MFSKKQEKSTDDFWREFEEKTKEKVLTYTLGQFISGWEEFDSVGITLLWGLVITTSGGFRFHHFPQQNWLSALVNPAANQKEKTIFIPNEQIISVSLNKETRWWKKILTAALPVLTIKYYNEEGMEKSLLIQTEYKIEGFAENLQDRTGTRKEQSGDEL